MKKYKITFFAAFREICQKSNPVLFALYFCLSILIYTILCIEFSLFPILVLIYFVANFRLLNLLLDRFMFYFTCFTLIFVFFVLLLNFSICNFHIAYIDYGTETLSTLLNSVKQNVLFNDNYNPFGSVPVNGKESSIDHSVYDVRVCHQETMDLDEQSKFILLLSEQKSSVLAKNVFKCSNYSGLPDNQLYLLKHYINVLKIHKYVADGGAQDPLICINGYTHARNRGVYGGIELAHKNLYNQARSQYSTPLYQVDMQFMNFIRQTEFKLGSLDCDANQIVPMRLSPQTCKHPGFLITGERAFLDKVFLSVKSSRYEIKNGVMVPIIETNPKSSVVSHTALLVKKKIKI